MTPPTAQDLARTEAMSFVEKLNDVILNPLIYFLLAVALLWFLYGAFEYLVNANSDQGREVGKRHMLWGLVGLLVMVSAWGILTIATNTFGLSGDLNTFTPTQISP